MAKVRQLLINFTFRANPKLVDQLGASVDNVKAKSEQAGQKFGKFGELIARTSAKAAQEIHALDQQARIFGDHTGAVAAKSDRLRAAIVHLTEQGVVAQDQRIQHLVAEWRKLQGAMVGTEKKASTTASAMGAIGRRVAGVVAAYAGFQQVRHTIASFAEFEAKLRESQSFSKATEAELKKLSHTAINLGVSTKLGAEAAADGLIELGSAGMDTNQSIAALPYVLQLARAGSISVADATALAMGTMKGFRKTTADLPSIVDTLAAAAGASSITIRDLGGSFKYFSSLGGTFGQNVGDLATFLAVAGDTMVKGEQAGTTLRGVFQRLIDPSQESADAMAELHLSVKSFADAKGNMLPLPAIMDKFRRATAGMGNVKRGALLSKIFQAEALAGVAANLDRTSTAWDGVKKKVTETGAAAFQASTRARGEKAEWEGVESSIQAISFGFQEQYAPAVESALNRTQAFFEAIRGGKVDPSTTFGRVLGLIDEIGKRFSITGQFMLDVFDSRLVRAYADMLVSAVIGTFKVFDKVIKGIADALARLFTGQINPWRAEWEILKSVASGVGTAWTEAANAFLRAKAILTGGPMPAMMGQTAPGFNANPAPGFTGPPAPRTPTGQAASAAGARVTQTAHSNQTNHITVQVAATNASPQQVGRAVANAIPKPDPWGSMIRAAANT